MNFKQRIDKLSKSIDEIQFAQGGIRVCFQELGQTKEEAMATAGIEPNNNALTVIVVKWASSHEPGYPLQRHLAADKAAEKSEPDTAPDTLEKIDSELEQLKSKLRQDGDEKDTVVISDGIPENPNKIVVNEPDTIPEDTEDGLLKVEPMRADPFLTGMSR